MRFPEHLLNRRRSSWFFMFLYFGLVVPCLENSFALASTPVVSEKPTDKAADANAALKTVETLNNFVLQATKSRDLKEARLRPVLDQSFNFSVMAAFAVGPSWNSFSAEEKTALINALSRYTTARFIHAFKDFGNKSFYFDPNVQVLKDDHLVRVQINNPGDAPDKLGYRLRNYGGQWRIIDVIFNGISELATQRADFAETLKSGHISDLIKRLDQTTMKLK